MQTMFTKRMDFSILEDDLVFLHTASMLLVDLLVDLLRSDWAQVVTLAKVLGARCCWLSPDYLLDVAAHLC